MLKCQKAKLEPQPIFTCSYKKIDVLDILGVINLLPGPKSREKNQTVSITKNLVLFSQISIIVL